MAVATVGSTSFSLLVEAVLSPASLHALAAHGITSLLVQHGTVPPHLGPWLRPLKPSSQYTFIDAPSLTVTLEPFVAEIDELLGRARIAITHAGSGSILAALRPSGEDEEPREVRRLIVVPNDTLMDSHQADLAEQIVRSGCGVSCGPSKLAETIAGLDLTGKTINGETLGIMTKGGPRKFRALVDREMGFPASES